MYCNYVQALFKFDMAVMWQSCDSHVIAGFSLDRILGTRLSCSMNMCTCMWSCCESSWIGHAGLIPRLLVNGSGNKAMVWYINKRRMLKSFFLHYITMHTQWLVGVPLGVQWSCKVARDLWKSNWACHSEGKRQFLMWLLATSAHTSKRTFSMKTQLSEKFWS